MNAGQSLFPGENQLDTHMPLAKKTPITIVDYGLGNLGSIKNMLHYIGVDAVITSEYSKIAVAKKLILPGVGAFDSGMRELKRRGIHEILSQRVIEDKTPVLGICLGAQLMTRGSEEGDRDGLGWFQAETVRFQFNDADQKRPVPNIGWRYIKPCNEYTLLKGFGQPAKFYFVHSYYIRQETSQDVAMISNYGLDFIAGMQRENIYSVQFHPEKSHKFGLYLMRRFVDV